MVTSKIAQATATMGHAVCAARRTPSALVGLWGLWGTFAAVRILGLVRHYCRGVAIIQSHPGF